VVVILPLVAGKSGIVVFIPVFRQEVVVNVGVGLGIFAYWLQTSTPMVLWLPTVIVVIAY